MPSQGRRRSLYPALLGSVASTVLLLTSACGVTGANMTSGVPIDWDSPVGGAALTISDPSEADVPFRPDVPRGLGPPVEIEASDPGDIDDIPADRQIAWVFDHPEYGRFWVTQWLVDAGMALAEWDEEAASGPVGCHGAEPAAGPSPPSDPDASGSSPVPPVPIYSCTYADLSLVTVGEGALGLLMQGQRVTSLEWMQPARNVDQAAVEGWYLDPMLLVGVMGPADVFEAEMALSISELGRFDAEGPITPIYSSRDCLDDYRGCIDAWLQDDSG